MGKAEMIIGLSVLILMTLLFKEMLMESIGHILCGL